MSAAALAGVNFATTNRGPGVVPRVASRLLTEGVRFRAVTETVPWLVGVEPVVLDDSMHARLRRIAQAIFDYTDAIQDLYASHQSLIVRTLDGLSPGWVCGLDQVRRIEMFRLDVLLEDGAPRVTEVEEIFGNAGKAVAMSVAYGLPAPHFVDFLARRNVRSIVVCDDYPEYVPEVSIVARALADTVSQPVTTQLISEFTPVSAEAVWRFAGVTELERYGPATVRALVDAGLDFVNPLFHGFGAKSTLALVHDPAIDGLLHGRVEEDTVDLLRSAVPVSRLVSPHSVGNDVMDRRKDLVLKVIACPSHPSFTWGSRGVFFGERSRKEWEVRMNDANAGVIRTPNGALHSAQFVLSDLVDADRTDVEFLHPDQQSICRMPDARCRLAPIYVREGSRVAFAGGHATFVNTSRKVHLGQHAVCAPLV